MSVRYASQSNTNNTRDVPSPSQTIPPFTGTTWTRPSDWLSLPSISTSDNKFAGLVAVTNDTTNYITFSATGTGLTYDIDWGDGTSQTGVSTGTILQKTYDYATLSSVVATAGYKMAVVSVTVTGGTFTTFSLTNAPTNIGVSTAYSLKWLDIAFAGSNLTTYTISGVVTAASTPLLQQVNIISANSFYRQLFGGTTGNGAINLQSMIIGSISTPITTFASSFANTRLSIGVNLSGVNLAASIDTQSMYYSISTLCTVPDFPTTTKITNITTMFFNCTSLRSVPKMDLSTCTLATSCFSGCSSLTTCPNLYMPLCTAVAQLFLGCTSLVTAPLLQLSNTMGGNNPSIFSGCTNLISSPGITLNGATTCGSIFLNCTKLQSVGVISSTTAQDCSQMFSGCASLTYIAGLNFTSTVTNIALMFSGCTQLPYIPSFNTSNVTNYNSTFLNCASLLTVPAIDTTKATNLTSTFNNCASLTAIPSLTTPNITLMTNTFTNCNSLTSVPLFFTGNVTTFDGAFYGCSSLTSVPTYDMTKATSLSSTFTNCRSLNSVPAFNTSNVLTMTGAFQNTGLTTAPSIDMTKVTGMLGIFANCSALNSIPAYNLSNVTGGVTNGLTGLPSLSNIQMTGLKVAHNIGSDKLGKTELETYFANGLGSNTTSQSVTVSGNPGADTGNAKTSGTTAGSNVITMANTLGIIAGTTMIYGTGVNTGIPVTLTAAGSTVQYTNGGGVNGLANNDNVMFTAIVTTTGIVINTTYWVVNRTSTTFQVSATQGGTALTLTNNGTATMSIGGATLSNRIVTVNANANVIINGVCGITNAAAALATRNLNINYAVTKNWTLA